MEPSEWTGGRRILAPRGKTLGGSSSINGHIYNRGQRMDFDAWAQLGNRGWGYADVLPYFKRWSAASARAIRPSAAATAGSPSPTSTGATRCARPSSRARSSLGIPRNPDYNGAIQEGIAYAQRTIDNGRRVSAATAFLHPGTQAPEPDGAHPRARHRADVRGQALRRRALSPRAGAAAPHAEVRARREVILSGGTYNSPQLLQLSGIGPPRAPASRSGIPVRHALPGVGENLRDHYAPRFTVRVKNIDTINERARGLKLAREIVRYVTDAQGHPRAQPRPWSTASGAPSPASPPRTCSSPSRRRAIARACRASSNSSPA